MATNPPKSEAKKINGTSRALSKQLLPNLYADLLPRTGMWLGFEMYLGDALCGIPIGTHNVYYVKRGAMLGMFISYPIPPFTGLNFSVHRYPYASTAYLRNLDVPEVCVQLSPAA